MDKALYLIAMTCLALCSYDALGHGILGTPHLAPVPRVGGSTVGLMTSVTELGRFTDRILTQPYADIWDAASTGSDLEGHASTSRDSFAYDIYPGEWEGGGSTCEPVDLVPSGDEYEMREAAAQIYAMALAGVIDSDDTYFAAVEQRILEMTAIVLPKTPLGGGNQCILDFGSTAALVVEAAILMQSYGYAPWSEADQLLLANWLATETSPILSWAASQRKNNWGGVTLRGMLASAHYMENRVDTFTDYTASQVTPTAYLATVPALWLQQIDNVTPLDSDCVLADPVRLHGMSTLGGFADDLRRETPVDMANCEATSMAFSCDGAGDPATCGLAHGYHHKQTQAMVAIAEGWRRINNSDLFDSQTHGGTEPSMLQAFQFGVGADYQTYRTSDTRQGARWMLASYYGDYCIAEALENSPSGRVRGGMDVPYSIVTHNEFISNASAWTACP